MPQTDPVRSNRRLSRRLPAKGRVRVVCRRGTLDLGPNLALAVLDVSETGARLAVQEPLEAGREVSVSLEGQSNLRPVVRVGAVAWCVPAADGTHCVGVRFQRRLPYRDFLEFSREPSAGASRAGENAGPLGGGRERPEPAPAPGPGPDAPPAAPERRRFERRPGQRLFNCRLSAEAGGPDVMAAVFDLSPAGVGLMASRRPTASGAVVLRISAAGPSRPALDLPLRVIYEEEWAPGRFAIGADFLRPLSAEEFQAILFRMGVASAGGA